MFHVPHELLVRLWLEHIVLGRFCVCERWVGFYAPELRLRDYGKQEIITIITEFSAGSSGPNLHAAPSFSLFRRFNGFSKNQKICQSMVATPQKWNEHSPLAFICENGSDSSLITPSLRAKSGDFIANSARLFCISSSSSVFKRFNATFGVLAMIASASIFIGAGGGGSSGNTFCSCNFGSCEKTALLFDKISLISSNCLLVRCWYDWLGTFSELFSAVFSLCICDGTPTWFCVKLKSERYTDSCRCDYCRVALSVFVRILTHLIDYCWFASTMRCRIAGRTVNLSHSVVVLVESAASAKVAAETMLWRACALVVVCVASDAIVFVAVCGHCWKLTNKKSIRMHVHRGQVAGGGNLRLIGRRLVCVNRLSYTVFLAAADWLRRAVILHMRLLVGHANITQMKSKWGMGWNEFLTCQRNMSNTHTQYTWHLALTDWDRSRMQSTITWWCCCSEPSVIVPYGYSCFTITGCGIGGCIWS